MLRKGSHIQQADATVAEAQATFLAAHGGAGSNHEVWQLNKATPTAESNPGEIGRNSRLNLVQLKVLRSRVMPSPPRHTP